MLSIHRLQECAIKSLRTDKQRNKLMNNDITKEKKLVKKEIEINEYISIRIVNSNLNPIMDEGDIDEYRGGKVKIVIAVRNKTVISIPSAVFPSFKHTIQDLNKIIDNNTYQEDSIIQEVLFQILVDKLLAWIKNDYNTRFLYYKIAFPLLHELQEVGETKFQIIFQQEILKTYATCSRQVKKFLEYEGYLDLIGKFF
ncbi:MAG: hypothetical protein ACXABO_15745 [Promethearchaeota archaeon]